MYRYNPARPGVNTRERWSKLHSLIISPQYLNLWSGNQQAGDRVHVYDTRGRFYQTVLVEQLLYWDRDCGVVRVHLGTG